MSGQSGGYRLHLSTLNDQLTCKLCRGYFIDATTIIECLHSFCRSCIIKYLENNKYCPICEVQVHKSKPLLNIRPDHTLQDIVYKLVPGCYQNEMRCRREFYSKNPEARSQAGSPESRGEPIESHIYSLDESLSLSLEYHIPNSKEQEDGETESSVKSLPRRYLRCPAGVTVFHLQKLIRAKHGLSDAHKVDIMYNEEPLCGSYTLMDVMYIYHWRRKVPLHLSYRIFESSPKRIKLSEDNHVYEQILSNTRLGTRELKSEQPEKREWKEVQLKISETGVMSVTDISTFEKKNTSNGDDNLGEIVTVCKTIGKVQEEEAVDTAKKKAITVEPKKEVDVLSNTQSTQNTRNPNAEVLKCAGNILPAQKMTKSFLGNRENSNSGSSKLQSTEPRPTTGQGIMKAVTRSDTESEYVGSCTPKAGYQSKTKNNLMPDSDQAKNGHEYPNAKKVSDRSINTNNNFTNSEAKIDNCKEHSNVVGKEGRSTTSGVVSKQNMQSSFASFQQKVGQVNNTYSKKIPKEKKSALIGCKKLDPKTAAVQPKSDDKMLTNVTNTKSHIATKLLLAKQTSTVVSPPRSTDTSIRAVNTFVGTSQSNSSSVSVTETTAVPPTIDDSSTPSLTKTVLVSQENSDCQTVRDSDQRSVSETTVNLECASQQVALVKNNNNNSPPTGQNFTTIGPIVSTAMPCHTETTSSLAYGIQSLIRTCQTKTADSSGSEINVPIETRGSNVSEAQPKTQSMSIYPVATPIANNTSFPVAQTSNCSKRINLQPELEITGIYTVPPCPDAIPISSMKPTVRKHEIIAKGTNLNEICAKIGESSKEKIKAATRSKPELPNLLKITKKNVTDINKCMPNVPSVATISPGNSAIVGEDKTSVLLAKELVKASSVVAASQSVPSSMPLQKSSSVKKQSQPVGYKTLRDPPKSWNPTLSKNNYVAVRNQAKEMQRQTQGALVTSSGTAVKPIHSKPAKIFKMRNVPRYLGNPASGVKPMYGVANENKEKDQVAQSSPKSSPLSIMTIDPKTLSPIVSTVNSPIISPPPPYSPNARSYQNAQFPRDMCRNPGSPISPRNSPVNMLSTNPFIPSPTLNTNPRLIYTPFPPPFPDTSRFPNPLIRSPIGIPSPSAFHSSLPPSINKHKRTSYHVPAAGYAASTASPTIQKILPAVHSSTKSSTAVNPSSMFTLGKSETQISTRVENIALHLAKNAAQQEQNIFNLSKTGNSTPGNYQTLSTTTTLTLSTSGYTSAETLHNTMTQTVAETKFQSGAKILESDVSKVKSIKETETVNLESVDEAIQKVKTSERDDVDTIPDEDVEKKVTTVVKVNGEIATHNHTALSENNDDEIPSQSMELVLAPLEKKQSLTESTEMSEQLVETSIEKASDETKSEEAMRKTPDQIQGKKSDVHRNKPES